VGAVWKSSRRPHDQCRCVGGGARSSDRLDLGRAPALPIRRQSIGWSSRLASAAGIMWLWAKAEPLVPCPRQREDVAPAARLAASPTAKVLEQRRELSPPPADPEHLGDSNHGHDAQLRTRVLVTAGHMGRPSTQRDASPSLLVCA